MMLNVIQRPQEIKKIKIRNFRTLIEIHVKVFSDHVSNIVIILKIQKLYRKKLKKTMQTNHNFLSPVKMITYILKYVCPFYKHTINC